MIKRFYIQFCFAAALSFLITATIQAAPPIINTEAELVIDFLTTEDGVLNEDDDLVFDADLCIEHNDLLDNPTLAPDGHQLTWGELNQVKGKASIKCDNNGTHVTLHLTGLVPKGVYTIWLLVFEAPGFDGTFDNLTAEGSLGAPDGSENSFTASAAGTASISVHQPAGLLSEGWGNEVSDCLFGEFEFHLVGGYHPDGKTYGEFPGPVGEDIYCYFIEHFAFVFKP